LPNCAETLGIHLQWQLYTYNKTICSSIQPKYQFVRRNNGWDPFNKNCKFSFYFYSVINLAQAWSYLVIILLSFSKFKRCFNVTIEPNTKWTYKPQINNLRECSKCSITNGWKRDDVSTFARAFVTLNNGFHLSQGTQITVRYFEIKTNNLFIGGLDVIENIVLCKQIFYLFLNCLAHFGGLNLNYKKCPTLTFKNFDWNLDNPNSSTCLVSQILWSAKPSYFVGVNSEHIWS